MERAEATDVDEGGKANEYGTLKKETGWGKDPK